MGNRPKNAECPAGKLLQVGHLKLYSGCAGVIFSLRESYIAATQQLYYIRLQNWAKPNITWRKPNITAKQYNSPKANIAEKTVIASQSRSFHGGRYRTRTCDLMRVKHAL